MLSSLDKPDREIDRAWAEESERRLDRYLSGEKFERGLAVWRQAWRRLGPRVRRYRLKRFPYGIVYAPLPSEIVVIAIMRLHRKPGYWTKRLKQL